MRRVIKVKEQLAKSIAEGKACLNVRCMGTSESQSVELTRSRVHVTESGMYVNVNIPTHDCWLSNRAAPDRTEEGAVHKLALLLDNYLAFCYGELYSLEDKRKE
jgi:hypothetical protein